MLLNRKNYVSATPLEDGKILRMQIIGYYGHDAYTTRYRGTPESRQAFLKEYYARDIEYDSGSDCDAPWKGKRAPTQTPQGARMSGRRYVMELFGVTATGESCTLHVEGFHPYFYVRTSDHKGILHRLSRIGVKYGGLIKTEVVHKRPYMGTYEKDYAEPYVKVLATNGFALKKALGVLRRDYGEKFCLSNLDNWYKFIHGRDIKASGWIEAIVGPCTERVTTTNIEYHCRYENLKAITPANVRGGLAPIVGMSYDIEATTDDGIFRSHDRDEEYPIQITMHYEWIGFWNTKEELERRGLKRLPQILLTLKKCAKITREDRVKALRESYMKQEPLSFRDFLLEKLHPWFKTAPAKLKNVGSLTIDQVCDMIADPIVIECETVADMLLRWSLIVRDMDHDIHTGYNIFNYDEQKLMREMLKPCYGTCKPSRPTGSTIEHSTQLWEACRYNFSRLIDKPAAVYEELLKSSGMGENTIYFIEMCGRVVYDTMKNIQKSFKKYTFYSLDFLVHEELNLHKVDFSTNDIIENFRVGLPQNIRNIAIYALQDGFVTQCLTNQLKHVVQNFSVSDIQYTPLQVIYTAGQGKPIFSLTVYDAMQDGKIPDVQSHSHKIQYSGGTVLSMRRGFYPRPMFVLDFTSLFPNVIRDYNISPDTIHPGVPDASEIDKYQRLTYNLPGVADEVVVYAMRPDVYRGVLPRMFDRLLARRISVQALAKDTTDPAEKEAYECIAGACKITNNSTYGTSADNKFKAHHKHIGPLTTKYAGVHLILKAQYAVEHTSRIIGEYLREQKIYDEKVLSELLNESLPNQARMDDVHEGFVARGYRGIGPVELEYGDTDSIFVYMPELPVLPGDDQVIPDHPHNKPGNNQTGSRAPPESSEWRPVMTYGKKRQVEVAIAVAKRLEKEYNEHLKKQGYRSLETKYEKVYMGALMFEKKHYASPKYEHDSVMKAYEVRGLPQVRRSTPQLATVILDGFMRRQVDGNTMDEVAAFVRRVIDMLYDGEVDLKHLIMTKKIKPAADLDKPESQAHIVLSWIMTERDAMTAPKINDRLRYVYRQVPNSFTNPVSGRICKAPDGIVPKFRSKWFFEWANGGMQVTERTERMKWEHIVCRIEGYEYALEHKIKIDYDAYVERDILTKLASFAHLSLKDTADVCAFLCKCLGSRHANFGNLEKYLKKSKAGTK